MAASNASSGDGTLSASQQPRADFMSELYAILAALEATTLCFITKKTWTNLHAYVTSELPRRLSVPAAYELFDDILLIMQHMQTSDPFLSPQQVRVFTLCYVVLNDVSGVWKSYEAPNERTASNLYRISADILLDSTDLDLSYHCVLLLNKIQQGQRDIVLRKPLARKLMTQLYQCLRDTEESCMESDCRHCARVIEWQVALVEFLQHSLRDDPLLYPRII